MAGLLSHFDRLKMAAFENAKRMSSEEQILENQRILNESGFGKEGVDPQAQARSQIQLMMTSPIPSVRKQGLEMLSEYTKRASAPAATVAHSNAWKQATDMGLQPGSKEHSDMVRQLAFKPSGSSVNVSVSGKEYVSPEEARVLRYIHDNSPVHPFTPKEALVGRVYSIHKDQLERSEDAKRAEPIIEQMEKMLFDEKEGIYANRKNDIGNKVADTITSNVNYYTQSDPRIKAYSDFIDLTAVPFAKTLGSSSQLSNRDMERIEAVMPRLTGPNIDVRDVARIKVDNLKRIMKIHATNGMIKSSDLDYILKDFEQSQQKRKEAEQKRNTGWIDVPTGGTP